MTGAKVGGLAFLDCSAGFKVISARGLRSLS